MRIVSLAPSNTEILYALGVEDQVVAVTRFCDWPLEAKQKTQIGAWINTEPEKLRELEPDLIMTSYFKPKALEGWSGPGEVLHVAPLTMWEVFESIRTIGQAIGRTQRAEAVVQEMRDGFDRLWAARPEQSARVYMEEWFHPPMAAGNWVPELVALAGGEEVVADPGKPSAEFPFAALAMADPDLMVCHWYGWGERTNPTLVLERDGWQELRVVRAGRVHFINDSFINRPGPRLVEGAVALQKIFTGGVSGHSLGPEVY